ncbi:sulfite oxidase-like oxidoreductase [Herbiconiux daphne]|uniref:Sulfite oxidase-like oxidoreductase n=1 Tax=Herbiconiux daphne TaxID=2970914 RepID=A0ABT2GZS1_9MICO|nr:sulfite oxidase-like oxidoreductase [Herbiconiux daphne]MCS5733351.1 sulfite oxidase-like oxidoreductase [Herbiconiux daphne]
MGIVNPGFSGRGREADSRLPPGQYETRDFPVLSAGPTPNIHPGEWQFTITDEAGRVKRWTWEEFRALPVETVETDIHCVTRWSKFDTEWRGVSLDTLFAEVQTAADYTMVHSFGGYTTNLPLEDLLDGQAWIAFEVDGEPLDDEHGGPARLLVPHLYFWKSAKWVRGITMHDSEELGFWELNGYNAYGDPWKEQRYYYD